MTPSAGSIRPLRRRLLRLGLGLSLGYALVCALGAGFQRHMLYFPLAAEPFLPAGPGWEGLEDFSVGTSDGESVRGWWWPGTRPLTLLALHGNGGNRGQLKGWLRQAHTELGVGVCALDYRGYGGSSGTPTEEGLYRDAEAAADWLQARAAGPLVYVGISLGSGVAAELARRRPPAGLVLQTAFTSAVDIGAASYPWLPVRLLMSDRFDTESALTEVEAPLLVIQAERDHLIPPDHGPRLISASRGPAQLWVVPGAGHNDLSRVAGPTYWERLGEFLGGLDPGW